MADRTVLRATGSVLKVERLQGVGRGTGLPYDFRTCRLLVGGVDVVDVTLPDELPPPGQGSPVDWALNVGAAGGTLRCSYAHEWPSEARKAA